MSDEDDPTDLTVPWRDLLVETEQRLVGAGLDTARQEARWILEEVSGLEGAEWVLGQSEPATVRGVAKLDALVDRRLAGEPIQYVLGHWPFRTLDLLVDRRVLIPRPETEQVVERALAELDRLAASVEGRAPCVVDLGAGSGAIGLAIAAERPGTDVWSVDASADAVAVTRANLAGLGMAGRRVRVLEGSWFEPLPAELRGRVDLVVSNPPYVAAGDPLPPAVADWEPTGALVPGPTGLEAIDVIVPAALGWLARPGAVVLEIGETQGAAVAARARGAGFDHAEVHPDLAQRDRCVVARRTTGRS